MSKWLEEFNPFKFEPSTGRTTAPQARQVSNACANRENWSVAAFHEANVHLVILFFSLMTADLKTANSTNWRSHVRKIFCH
jgi:hypothetical protein